MEERFQTFVTDITAIYKSIQRIKKFDMESIGLKTGHVMCLNYLGKAKEGLTASELCLLTTENKAGISRTLGELEDMGCIRYTCEERSQEKRKYRARAVLTEKGREYADEVRRMADHAVRIGSAGLTDEERTVLYRVLAHVSQNLQGFCEELEGKKK